MGIGLQNARAWVIAALLAVTTFATSAAPQIAQAQTPDGGDSAATGEASHGDVSDQASDVVDPWRLMGLLSVGAPLRLTRRADLGQQTFAPPFIDVSGVLLLPGQGHFRHGPVLGLSANMLDDGGFYAPVDPFTQWVALIGYGATYAWGQDLFALAHLGMPFDLGASGSVGMELSVALAYRVLAGIGGFTALSADLFGAEGGVSAISALEVGVFIDYEVLP